jgi:hypothetical protein
MPYIDFASLGVPLFDEALFDEALFDAGSAAGFDSFVLADFASLAGFVSAVATLGSDCGPPGANVPL